MKKTKIKGMKKGKYYLVVWEDTFGRIRWLDLEEIKKEAEEAEGYIKTVGFYVGTFGSFEVVASSFNTNKGMADWGMITYIPKKVIIEVDELK